MGSSGSSIQDYVEINKNAVLSSDNRVNVLLTISYIKVGLAQNPQFYVTKAVLTPITDATSEKTLFVEYQEIASSA